MPGIIKIGSGSVRLGSGSFSLEAPPPLELPFQANLEHWYDFTDISVLWQNTAGTTPVNGNGQDIQNITDKGTSALDITEADTPRTFDNASFTFSVSGDDGVLSAAYGSKSFGPPQTYFLVYQINGGGIGIPFHIENTAGMEFETDSPVGTRFDGIYSGVGNQVSIGDTLNVWHAAIFVCRADGTQSLYHSLNAAPKNTNSAVNTQNSGSLGVGAFNSNNSNPHSGPIAECGAWNIDDGDEATLVDDFKAYVDDKYDIVWAT